MSDDCMHFNALVKALGTLILLAPVGLGFVFAWVGMAIVGTIIFVFFSLSAMLLDTVRWAQNNFRQTVPKNEENSTRLRKAAVVLVNIFRTMAELKDNELRAGLLAQEETGQGQGQGP